MKLTLIPRFRYSYNIIDFISSLLSIFLFKDKSKTVKQFFKTDNILFTNSGRSALTIVLKSLVGNKNALVGVQAYNCETVFKAIQDAGCTPVFIDTSSNFQIDLKDLEAKKNSIDIVIVTHLFGIQTEINSVKEIVGDKPIIEDRAHSLFGKNTDKETHRQSIASIFSFGYGKQPSIGKGGFIVSNNAQLIDKAIDIYNSYKVVSIKTLLIEVVKNYIFAIAYRRPVYGLITNPVIKKLDTKIDFLDKKSTTLMQAYRPNVYNFCKNFKRWHINSEKQISNGKLLYSIINEKFAPEHFQIDRCTFFTYPLLVDNSKELYNYMLKNNIECGKHFAQAIEWALHYGYAGGSCPNTEIIVNKIITFPIHYNLSSKTIRRIAKIIINYHG